jgi:hypothetical protein
MHTKFHKENLKARDHLGDLDIDGRKISENMEL